MQNMLRFSLFGDFEKFNTSNSETYVKLINFFAKKGYSPSTSNELLLQPNGQIKTLIMPVFENGDGNKSLIDITSGRINFQKIKEDVCSLETLGESFKNDLLETMNEFVTEFSIVSNRVALNCDINKNEVKQEMVEVSKYFCGKNKSENNIKNAIREKINTEESNIIFERRVNEISNITQDIYDINSVVEDGRFRFDKENVQVMYEGYFSIALEIEKGL